MLPKYMTNLNNLKHANSQQLSYLLNWKCKHRHNGIRHFGCFCKENAIEERKCFLDIETSNLKANFGIVLCWCILDESGNRYEDVLTAGDIADGYEDERVVASGIDCLKSFDRVITHYGTFFDIPFLRTRALIHKIKFPEYGTLWHTDVWKMAKKSLCLHSNRQDIIAESLYGKTVKTRISHPAWRKTMLGDAKAASEVLDHCRKDVQDLKKNYETLLPYCIEYKTSI